MLKVLFPGSFDPVTKGHMDIIDQGTNLFDEVIVAVLRNPAKKNPFFTTEERINLLMKLYENNDKVKIVTGECSSTDLALLYGCKALLRGLRCVSDFEYEIQLAEINKDISSNKVNSICVFASSNMQTISSSLVKEIFYLGKPISKYVDPIVEEAMKLKYKR